MKRGERKIYCRCIAIMAVYIISAVYFYTLPSQAQAEIAVKGSYEDETVAVEKMSTGEAETPKNGKIRENTASLRKVGEVEQETSEEVEDSVRCEDGAEVPKYEAHLSVPETETPEIQSDVRTDCPIYQVDGITPDTELQLMLYEALDRHSISYFYEIAWVQCYQESKWNVYAVNPHNLIDSGILQFRATYWDWTRGDLFSPQAQFDLYAEQMSARLNQGLSADECISRHKTSDYSTAVDWGYVQEVRQHLPNLRKVEL